MSEQNESVVRDFLDMLHTDQPDLSKAEAYFAPDAVYHAQVPTSEPLHGWSAIKGELERQFRDYKDCWCEILAMASTEQVVFTERRDHVTMRNFGDKRIFSSPCAVFEFGADGRIVSWREYWDTRDIMQQLDLTAESMNELMAARPSR